MTDDLPFLPGDPDPSRFERPARRCYRHEWTTPTAAGLAVQSSQAETLADLIRFAKSAVCARCGKARDEAAVSRNRRNAKRGKAIQRKRIEGLGGQNLPGNKPNHDGIGLLFQYESKSGGAFSERLWRWLKGIPLLAGQTGVLIVTETPGPGRRARSYVVVDYDHWRDLHGETKP